jgi:hypothetical protein
LVVVAAVAAGAVELATVPATVVVAGLPPDNCESSLSLLNEAETPVLLVQVEGRVATLPATNFTTEH